VSAHFGFDQPAGRFTYGPRVGINYGQTKIDPYSETGGTGLELRIEGRTVKSFQALVGFYGGWAISTKNGIVLPQFTVGYVHEFEDDASIVTAQFAEDLRGPGATTFIYGTSVPDADFFNADAGVSVVFPRGIQFFVNLRAMIGNSNFDNAGGTVGIRFEL
jgi:outer membrane autotransporter protein